MSKISVTVQLGRWLDEVQTACIDVDDDYVRDEICRPLRTSDTPFAIFDTPDSVVHKVRRLRDNAAKDLARDITNALIKAFQARDTHNGYTAAERARIE